MEAEKTIICRILNPTKRKKGLLMKEYANAQGYIQGETEDLYSATKQAMDEYVEKVKEGKDYPLFLRNDTFKVEEAKNTEEFDYWVKIPIADVWGGIWLPIKPHEKIKEDYRIHDSKIVKKDYGFELHLSVSKKAKPQTPRNILAVDLGERVMATTVSSADNENPKFYGREIRGIRRHFAWLRKRLQERGRTKKLREISNREERKVEDILHKISRKIVQEADEQNAIIVIGDLKGLGNRNTGKGKQMNRIVNSMPYYKLTRMIEYKAKEKGITVVKVPERNTSKICHKCGSENTKRPAQGRFDCKTCGLRNYNADLNGAKNILQRFLAYMVRNGASVNRPLTEAYLQKNNIKVTEKVLRSPFLAEG